MVEQSAFLVEGCFRLSHAFVGRRVLQPEQCACLDEGDFG
jgi:hypothetical protein